MCGTRLAAERAPRRSAARRQSEMVQEIAARLDAGEFETFGKPVRVAPARFGATCEDIGLVVEGAKIESCRLWKPMHAQSGFADCAVTYPRPLLVRGAWPRRSSQRSSAPLRHRHARGRSDAGGGVDSGFAEDTETQKRGGVRLFQLLDHPRTGGGFRAKHN